MFPSRSASVKNLLMCAFALVCLCGALWHNKFSVMDQEESEYVKRESSTTIFPDTTRAHSTVTTVAEKGTTLSICPEKSPHLVGTIRENLKNLTLDQVETSLNKPKELESFSAIGPSGHYSPKDCTARQKLAILIPFRNRHKHLPILLNNLIPVLRRQQVEFCIYVIEQEPGVTFNKGLLFNVGFITALTRQDFDCVVLHDADCLPLNDNNLYRCENNPRHLLASGSKWDYTLPYEKYFGGAAVMRREHYLDINGYSNLYFGWGSEDDDLRLRILNRGYQILRYPESMGRYYQIIHGRDEGNAENFARFRLIRRATRRFMNEGLRTAVYHIKSIEEKPLFVWIRVSVNMTKVLNTAPNDARDMMKFLFDKGKKFDKMGLGHSGKGDKFKLPS